MNTHAYTVTYRNGDSEDVQAARVEENDTSYLLYGADGTPALVAPADIVRSIRKND
jgi:hypothetical protein